MRDFIFMGSYAAYIWPAWLIGVLILVGITLTSIHRHRQAFSKLRELTSTQTSTETKAENG